MIIASASNKINERPLEVFLLENRVIVNHAIPIKVKVKGTFLYIPRENNL